MKTLIELEQPEVEEIFSAEGFLMTLANGQQIRIRAPGALRPLSDLRELRVLPLRQGFGEWPVASSEGSIRGENAPAPQKPKRKYRKRRQGRKPRAARAARRQSASAGFPCDDCDYVAKTAQGLGGHRRKHGAKKTSAAPPQKLDRASAIAEAAARRIAARPGLHSKDVPSTCPYCDAYDNDHEPPSAAALYGHIRHHHPDKPVPWVKERKKGMTGASSPPDSRSRGFVGRGPGVFLCKPCNIEFATKTTLDDHQAGKHGVRISKGAA